MQKKETIIVSACLLGENCKYSGGNNYFGDEKKNILCDKYEIIPVCPEVIGGLPTPRYPCEIKNNKVYNNQGENKTFNFKSGAEQTLKIAKDNDVKLAVLKANSPSCGHGHIYDGSFSGKIIEGNGITANLLRENGIKVINENDI